MGLVVVCAACGKRLAIPDRLYEARIRGRVVTIDCRLCGAAVTVDGTGPPPSPGGSLQAELSLPPRSPGPDIPKPPAVPRDLDGGEPAPGRAAIGSSPERAAVRLDADDWAHTERSASTGPPQRRTSTSPPPIGEARPIATIGRYALFGQFASGGMATVHLGRLDGVGGFSRVVAVKRLLPHLVKNQEFTDMLLKEARLAARVRHPNVIPMLDAVASKGDVLLVMEYVHGEALSALCRAHVKQKHAPIPVEIVISIVHDTLEGLEAVHEATDERGRLLGLVHRDVSPQNVLVGVEGVARVFDFGVAKAREQVEETLPNRIKGKTAYMSPEQIRGEPLTRRSDVFAAGIILWELITLRRLFAATNDAERLSKIMSGVYPRPSEMRPELPPEADAVVMRALAFDPEERYATALDFAEALHTIGASAPARVVGEWVAELAATALTERASLLAAVENWDEERHGGAPSSRSMIRSLRPPRPSPVGVEPPAGSAARRWGMIVAVIAVLLVIGGVLSLAWR